MKLDRQLIISEYPTFWTNLRKNKIYFLTKYIRFNYIAWCFFSSNSSYTLESLLYSPYIHFYRQIINIFFDEKKIVRVKMIHDDNDDTFAFTCILVYGIACSACSVHAKNRVYVHLHVKAYTMYMYKK